MKSIITITFFLMSLSASAFDDRFESCGLKESHYLKKDINYEIKKFSKYRSVTGDRIAETLMSLRSTLAKVRPCDEKSENNKKMTIEQITKIIRGLAPVYSSYSASQILAQVKESVLHFERASSRIVDELVTENIQCEEPLELKESCGLRETLELESVLSEEMNKLSKRKFVSRETLMSNLATTHNKLTQTNACDKKSDMIRKYSIERLEKLTETLRENNYSSENVYKILSQADRYVFDFRLTAARALDTVIKNSGR